MIAAADAPLRDDAVFEGRLAVGSAAVEEADTVAAVAEQHQVLAQDAERERQVRKRRGSRDRMPEATQVLAARGAGARPGQLASPAGISAW